MDKKFLLFLIFICILSISAVSAQENIANDGDIINQTDAVMVKSDSETASFTDLNNDIVSIESGGNYTLKKDYTYLPNESNYKNGILIDKDNITIDGNGHTIDGAGEARIFNITSTNVTLKNITFVNGYSSEDGGAIFTDNSLNIFDSKFINNSAKNSGGAIYFEDVGEIINCEFYNNRIIDQSGDGGAVYFSSQGTISDSIFNNNTADSWGGAAYFSGTGAINDCKFTNNSAKYYGGAISFFKEGKILNSNFKDNNAQNGGSLYIYGIGIVDNCNFTDNNARTGGAIELWRNGTITHSIFISNVAGYGGGALYLNDDVKISDCIFTNNSANVYSGGAIYVYSFADLSNCNFTDNSASSYGGAVCLNSNGTITKSIFKSNKAEDGGAILAGGDLLTEYLTFKDNNATSGNDDISLKGNATVLYMVHLTVSEVSDVYYGNIMKITVNVTSEGIAVNSGNVSVSVSNKLYSHEVINGSATIEIPNLDAGEYYCSVIFDGTNYAKTTENVTFKVLKDNLVIIANNKEYIINYNGKYSITVRDIKNNPVSGVGITLELNGKIVGASTTNSNGVATVDLSSKTLKSLKAGVKNIVIKTSNLNYNSATKTVKITISKEKIKITAKAKKFKRVLKTKKYALTLKNSKGKAVKNLKVTLKVKGKTYKATSNKNGKTTFKITKLNKKGKFTAAVKFAGNSYYKTASKKVKITVV